MLLMPQWCVLRRVCRCWCCLSCRCYRWSW